MRSRAVDYPYSSNKNRRVASVFKLVERPVNAAFAAFMANPVPDFHDVVEAWGIQKPGDEGVISRQT
jgi:hypothetical protein